MDEQSVPPPPPTPDPATPPFDFAPTAAVPSSPLDSDQPDEHGDGSGMSRKFVAALVGVGVAAAVTGGAVGASLASTDQDGRHQAVSDHTNTAPVAPSTDASSDARVGSSGNGQGSEQAAPGSADGAQDWSAQGGGFAPQGGGYGGRPGGQRSDGQIGSDTSGSNTSGSNQSGSNMFGSHSQSGAS